MNFTIAGFTYLTPSFTFLYYLISFGGDICQGEITKQQAVMITHSMILVFKVYLQLSITDNLDLRGKIYPHFPFLIPSPIKGNAIIYHGQDDIKAHT